MKTANITGVTDVQSAPIGDEPRDTQHYWGSDARLHTKVGERLGNTIRTTGRSGLLVYGPYAPFSAGTYQLTVKGTAQNTTAGCWLDVACDLGQRCLIRVDLPQANASGEWTAIIEFVLEFSVKNLETRLWVPATANLILMSIAIAPALLAQPGMQAAPKTPSTAALTSQVSQVSQVSQKQNKKIKRR